MRFRERRTVVLPQPDGPMNAVISLAAISRSTLRTAVTPLYWISMSWSSKTSSRGFSAGSSVPPSPAASSGSRTSMSSGGRVSTSSTIAGAAVLSLMTTPMSGCRGAARVDRGDDPRQRGEEEDEQDQGQRGAVPPLQRARERRRGVPVDLGRERGVRPVEGVPVRGRGDPDREQQRSGLARGSGDGEERRRSRCPASAWGRTTVRIVRTLRLPSAKLPSRSSLGTRRRISSVVRITMGSIRAARARAPAKPFNSLNFRTNTV